MVSQLVYCGGALDRAAVKRRDPAWLEVLLKSETTQIVPVWRARSLIVPENGGDTGPAAATLMGEASRAALALADHLTFLGIEGEAAFFAADFSHHEEDALLPLLGDARFTDLRQVGGLLTGPEAVMLAFARGMVHWHGRARYCSDCGSATEPRHGGYVRACTNLSCGVEHFPRTDPAVITLVTRDGPQGAPKGGSCLLARQAQWPEGQYSSLAGFVEPGESLEECVAREIGEEAGIEVTDIRYRASQPWPFPASLMIDFRARAVTFDIQLHDGELEHARWFSKDEIRNAPTSPLKRGRSDSIARWLLQEWASED